MKLLNEDIKTGQLKQLYLLYGAEDYLRRQYRDRLRQALAGQDTMNCHYFEGKNIAPGELINLAETMPFLAERRVIVVENSGFFGKGGDAKGGGALAEYLKDMAETAYIVFVETEVDKRGRLFKTVKDRGRITEFVTQDEATLTKWILGMIGREGKKITGQDLRYFLEKTGADMENISKELEKLFCYTLDRDVITAADIDAVCTQHISNRIFDMVSAVSDKNQKKALDLYYDLLSLKEPPMRILFLIARQFNLLLQVKELRKKGNDNRVIAEKVGVPPFAVGKYVSQSSGFDREQLRKALASCVEAEEAVKTGKLNDVMSVELLIIQYSAG
ncbi:MAG: DNA polymerase III subunit delta [Lachnospiraceae bacterium]|nr:DNA polymerase III subunit delta [Lachnospiraceae bacterium]MDY4069449.1 DNA polymerase III subunit delta [Lachnospiraceae bacterium]